MKLPVLLALVAMAMADQDLLRIQNSPVFSNLDSSSSGGSGGQYNKGSGSVHSSASASAGGVGASYGVSSSEQQISGGGSSGRIVPAGYGTNSFEGGKQLGQHQASFTSGGSSYEFGGAADSTGGYPSVYPGGSVASGGYPSTGATHTSQTHQVVEHGDKQPQGPAYTYYYQHYPSGAATTGGHGQGQGQGWSGGAGGEEGLFGGFGGGEGGGLGLAGLGGIGGLKGLGILGAIAKGVLAIKPFLILGLLFLIAFPVLLFFIPLPIITISGNGNMANAGNPNGQRRSGPTVTSYLTSLSEKVLSAEECLERVLCKMPQAPDNYQKKMRSLWDQYGTGFVKNTRVTRGLNAYFDTASSKNRNFKCNQRFQCSNKFL